MKASDLDGMSVKELKALEVWVAEALVERKAEEVAEVKAKLAELAEKSGFGLDELFGKGRRGKNGKGTVAAKYRNPADAAQTWTGRGRMPLWIKALTDKGAKKEKFLIK